MNDLDPDPARLRRYLLGDLPEEDCRALEERYFADEDVFAALLAAEEELLESHREGTLPAGERARFERIFLSSPAGRRQIRLAEDLRAVVRRGPRIEAASAGRRVRPFRLAAIAAVVLLALGGVWWLSRSGDGRRGAEQTAATRDEPRVAPPAGSPAAPPAATAPVSAPALLTVTLAAGLVRDVASPTSFAVPPGTEAVRLRLRLDREDFSRYRVSLQTPEGREIFSQDGLAARPTGSGRGLEAHVPAPSLAAGTYVAIVSGLGAGGRAEPAAEYVFRVERAANGKRP